MAATPTQPDPKEAVEAQLCAYLEGDLTPAERASIDRHLADHAQHRQLLADLALTRQWLRAVPRQPAPPDVGEAFQQQVERSLLLGEDGRDRSARPAAGRWPQRTLLAALLLLTVGLVVLIALMLAPPGRKGGRIALDSPPVRPPVVPTLPAPAPAVAPASPPEMKSDRATQPVGAVPMAPPPMARPGTAALPAPAPSPSQPFAAVAAMSPPLGTPVVAPRTVYLHVTTTEAVRVVAFLTRSGLTPEPILPVAAGVQRAAPPAGPVIGGNTSAGPKAVTAPQAGPLAIGFPRRYVVNGLTAAQAGQLTTDLRAEVAPATVTTESPPADGRPIARGDRLTVIVPQLSGPGVGPTNAVRVADDGTIALPMIDPVPAAGATPVDIAGRVAERYRQANLIAHPTVSVTPLPAATRAEGPPTAGGPTSVIVTVQQQ